MSRKVILIGFVLTIIQGLCLNDIFLSIWVNPIIYLIVPLSMPLSKRSKNLVIAFSFALIIDILQHVPGIHACSVLFLLLIRPVLLQIFRLKEINQKRGEILKNAFLRFTGYLFVSCLLYYTYANLINLNGAFLLDHTLEILGTSFLSVILMLLIYHLFIGQKEKT